MKVTIANLVLVLMLQESGHTRSLDGKPGQLPGPYDYEYTYGDYSYNYQDSDTREVDGYVTDVSTESNYVPEVFESDDVNHSQSENSQLRERTPHPVVDVIYNYEYTYGDPDVDYDYTLLPGDDDNDDHDADDDVEEERDLPEVLPTERSHKKAFPIVTSIIMWMFKNWEEAKFLRDEWKETKKHVLKSWRSIKYSMKRIRKALRSVFKKFGADVEEGLKYCLFRFKEAGQNLNKEGSDVLDKLEKLLEDGNQMVGDFFRLLGQKIKENASRRNSHVVNKGDGAASQHNAIVKVSSYIQLGGKDEEIEDYSPSTIPDLFKDQEVIQNMEAMLEKNILTREEVEALLNATGEQTTFKSNVPQKNTSLSEH